MGWLWFIPAFHMPTPPAGSEQPEKTKFVLKRKEIDFALGIGSSIIDVEISLEWLKETDAERVQPPARLDSDGEKAQGIDDAPTGIAAAVQAVTADSLQGVPEAKQASED
jgi:phosphatidylinositol-3,4,5-trisphosphate 3-phosphatase/dual-specificity protein phosphatase PTEN